MDLKEPADESDKGQIARKQIQCPFRLLNILFLDEFAADFGDLGNVASRQILDLGKAGNQEHFWQRVSSAFLEDKETFGRLNFLDDEVMACYSYIDPLKINKHDWKNCGQLRQAKSLSK